MLTKIPAGLDEIIAVYGSIDDPKFFTKNIVKFALPYTIFYDKKPVNETWAHKKAVDHFILGFQNVKNAGLADQFCEFNGIYNKRSIRGLNSHPSSHSWGIAIDMEAFDPATGNKITFPLKSKNRLPEPIVLAMRAAGFFYGGDFISRKDPMHFQLCTKY